MGKKKAPKIKDLEQYKQLHAGDASYGATGLGYLIEIETLIKRLKFSQMIPIHTFLDFGCGKGNLVEALKQQPALSVDFLGYDPAVPGYEVKPTCDVDMLVTTDVLEHVREEELSGVLGEMLAFNPQIMYHVVCCAKAGTILPDGTNAHKTVEGPCWWLIHLISEFDDYEVEMLGYNSSGPVKYNATFLCLKR